MHLSRITCFAVELLRATGQSTPVDPHDVVGADALPERYTRIIVDTLVSRGLLRRVDKRSVVLWEPASEITLLDVIEAVEGPIAPWASGGSETLQAALSAAVDHMTRSLAATTIADLTCAIGSMGSSAPTSA